MNTSRLREDAGDLPAIPIGPVESCHERESSVSHYRDKRNPIDSYFDFYDIIGDGGFSTVRKATSKVSGETFAVKILDKSKIKEDDFPRVLLEIETLATLKHPYICKLFSVFYTRSKIYMVMEYCYTDLFEYLVKLDEPMPESESRKIFVQLLSTIHYLHSVGIVHRDIKPDRFNLTTKPSSRLYFLSWNNIKENILLTQNMEIRLTDFGLSATIHENKAANTFEELLFTYCGSQAYCAPEIVLGIPYCGVKIDIWSLGVNLYVLLANELPFGAKTANEVKARIVNGTFHGKSHFSKKAFRLVRRILQVNPHDRPSLLEIWQDPWIREANPKEDLFEFFPTKRAPIDFSEFPDSPLYLTYKPICRSDPVEVDIPIKKSRFRRLVNFTRKKLQRILFCYHR